MTPHLPKPGTHAARILDELKKHPYGASDGQLARLLATRHEIVNSNCRLMEAQGLISRERQNGLITNTLIVRHPTANEALPIGKGMQIAATQYPDFTTPETHAILDAAPLRESPELAATLTNERPWFWEGNVQAVVTAFLEHNGWTIVRVANTETHERGKDIEATRTGSTLWVTVKSLPVAHPNAQARSWFSDAILDVVRYRQEEDAVTIAVALPESYIYQRWQERTVWLQRAAPFDFLWVGVDGAVRYDPGRPSIV